MEIRVIGSGAMMCERNSSSFIIDGNTAFDMPNGYCKNLYKLGIDPASIENVIITHFHGDHFFDLPFYLIIKDKYFDKKIKIYAPKTAEKKIKTLCKLAGFSNAIDFLNKKNKCQIIYEDKFKINSYKVEKVLLKHSKSIKSYGYLFDSGTVTVGFTGDTAMCDNLEYMLQKCNLIFIDCDLVKGNDKHLGVDNILELSNKYPECKFALTHLTIDSLKELKNIQKENVIILEDNELITI